MLKLVYKKIFQTWRWNFLPTWTLAVHIKKNYLTVLAFISRIAATHIVCQKILTTSSKITIDSAAVLHPHITVSTWNYNSIHAPKRVININLYSMIMPFKYYVFKNIIENGAYVSGANAPFSIILSKVSKTLLELLLTFFQCCLKIENDVMI